MYEITKRITNYNQSNKIFISQGVILHSTGNGEDTVDGNFSWFNTSDRGGNAHFFIDNMQIAQFVETWNKAWHARSPANELFWGIEMCETRNMLKFKQIWDRTVWLISHLFTKVIYPRATTISIDNLRNHHEENQINHYGDSSNHTDTTAYFELHGKDMNGMRYDVQKAIDEICFNRLITNKFLINSPEYWAENCKVKGKVKSTWVRQIVLNFVAMYKMCNSLEAVIYYLSQEKIINSPDLWKRVLSRDIDIDGMNVRRLFVAMGKRLI